MKAEDSATDFVSLLEYIKRSRGFDFTSYKHSTLIRRFQKRMQEVEIDSYPDYLDYLEVHPEEYVQLFNTILINVTTFFRDTAAWNYLAKNVIPRIITEKKPGEPIRVWSTGCASGEEAFSVAMLLAEALGEQRFKDQVKIYATDVDEEALAFARMGCFTEKMVANVPPELLEKYFTLNRGSYCFNKDLRRNLIFGRNDLIQDTPISRIDLLICRNTLMYFNAEAQAKILSRFHFALSDSGFLFLGKAEMLLTHGHTFTPVDLKLRFFQKVPRANVRDRMPRILNDENEEPANHIFNLANIREAAFDAMPTAQIVLDLKNAMVLANQEARRLFRLNDQDMGRPFQDFELSYRPAELRTSLQRVLTDGGMILLRDVNWQVSPAGEVRTYNIRIEPLINNGKVMLGVAISFHDITSYKQLQVELERTHHELETTIEELQSTNEELETTNEELQSTVEELETTNEELQSTNEELETMNEELQSTNEELQTLNDELHHRTQELNRVNAFLGSILSSLRAAVVVVDQDLRIQVWNREAEDLWGLREDEVQGKNFLTLDIGLPVEQLRNPLVACLTEQREVPDVWVEARNRRGKEIVCRITCTPLLGGDHTVEGLIAMLEEEKRGAAV